MFLFIIIKRLYAMFTWFRSINRYVQPFPPNVQPFPRVEPNPAQANIKHFPRGPRQSMRSFTAFTQPQYVPQPPPRPSYPSPLDAPAALPHHASCIGNFSMDLTHTSDSGYRCSMHSTNATGQTLDCSFNSDQLELIEQSINSFIHNMLKGI